MMKVSEHQLDTEPSPLDSTGLWFYELQGWCLLPMQLQPFSRKTEVLALPPSLSGTAGPPFGWQSKALILFPGLGLVCSFHFYFTCHGYRESWWQLPRNSPGYFKDMNVLLVVSWLRATDPVWKFWLWDLLPGKGAQKQKPLLSHLLQIPGIPNADLVTI